MKFTPKQSDFWESTKAFGRTIVSSIDLVAHELNGLPVVLRDPPAIVKPVARILPRGLRYNLVSARMN